MKNPKLLITALVATVGALTACTSDDKKDPAPARPDVVGSDCVDVPPNFSSDPALLASLADKEGAFPHRTPVVAHVPFPLPHLKSDDYDKIDEFEGLSLFGSATIIEAGWHPEGKGIVYLARVENAEQDLVVNEWGVQNGQTVMLCLPGRVHRNNLGGWEATLPSQFPDQLWPGDTVMFGINPQGHPVPGWTFVITPGTNAHLTETFVGEMDRFDDREDWDDASEMLFGYEGSDDDPMTIYYYYWLTQQGPKYKAQYKGVQQRRAAEAARRNEEIAKQQATREKAPDSKGRKEQPFKNNKGVAPPPKTKSGRSPGRSTSNSAVRTTEVIRVGMTVGGDTHSVLTTLDTLAPLLADFPRLRFTHADTATVNRISPAVAPAPVTVTVDLAPSGSRAFGLSVTG